MGVRDRGTSWVKWGGGGVRWGGRVDTLSGGVGGGGGGGGYVGGWGYVGTGVGVDVRSWSKMLFLGTFWKITTYWPPVDERVRSSSA